MTPSPDARNLHYGEFYRLRPSPKGIGPVVTVIGNCQAESLRILLATTSQLRSVRIPPVHEWTVTDLPYVHEILATTDVLISQPIRADYRGLPVGTGQLSERLPHSSSIFRFPVLRYDGLMPYQAIIRSPLDPSLNPPVLPYHDLRILAAADRGQAQPVETSPSAAAFRTLAEMSVAQLRSREQAHETVTMSDHLRQVPVWHTMNHPDNATLLVLARRLISRFMELGILAPGAEVTAPAEREMLGGLRAPIDADAARALGTPTASHGREWWSPDIDRAELVAAQLAFYRAHPEIVSTGMLRHSERMSLLGLSAG